MQWERDGTVQGIILYKFAQDEHADYQNGSEALKENPSLGVGLSFDGGLMVNAELQTRSAATALFSGHSSRHTLTHTALHPDYKKLLISVTLSAMY